MCLSIPALVQLFHCLTHAHYGPHLSLCVRAGQVVPAVHSDGVVPRLLLLLLHSSDDADHALPITGDAHFRPAMEVELSDLPALVLLQRKG